MKATIVWQRNWDALQAGYRYIINSGSSRSSKTHSILQIFYQLAWATPNTKLAVFRFTKKDCKDTVFEDMKKAYPVMPRYKEVVLNLTESVFKFPNGSSIHIEGTDDSVKVHGYHSDVLWFNESYDISRDTFDQLDMRCSGSVFIDLNPRQDHWSEDVAKKDRAITIHSTFRDNPFVPVEQRTKILSYQPVKLWQPVIDKLITEGSARTYDLLNNPQDFSDAQLKALARCIKNEEQNSADSFKWEVYGLGLKSERPNRIFKMNEIPLSQYLALDAHETIGCDWGSVDPWGIVAVKYYDGGLYFRELNYDSENVLREKLTNTDLASINAVATNEEEKRESVGLVQWRFQTLNIPRNVRIICDTNRPIKGNALRKAGYQAIPAIKGAGSIVDGIDLMNSYKLYYTSDSPNLKVEQEMYSRQVDRQGNVLEEPEDAYCHLLDAGRYACTDLQKRGIIRMV